MLDHQGGHGVRLHETQRMHVQRRSLPRGDSRMRRVREDPGELIRPVLPGKPGPQLQMGPRTLQSGHPYESGSGAFGSSEAAESFKGVQTKRKRNGLNLIVLLQRRFPQNAIFFQSFVDTLPA
jgi:hypothetical protein